MVYYLFLLSHNFPISFSTWILDIEVAHHVCCSLSTFTQSTPAQNSFVTLPNSQSVVINRIGYVFLSPDLILNNVMFVPNFHFNLLSISSLTQSYKSSINFMVDSCTKGHTWTKTIGMSRRHGSLYFLNIVNFHATTPQIFSPCNNVSLSQNEIWLYCLGHLSYVMLQTLKDEIEVKPNFGDSSHCLVLHLVKQCKLHLFLTIICLFCLFNSYIVMFRVSFTHLPLKVIDIFYYC